MNKKEIIDKTEAFVRANVPQTRKPDSEYFNHVFGARKYSQMLAKEYGADAFIVDVAIMLHDIGADAGPGHAEKSAELASEYLEEIDISKKQKELILSCIRTHSMGAHVDTLEQQIIQDADELIFIEDTYRYFHIKGRHRYHKSEEALQASIQKTGGMVGKIKTEMGTKISQDLLLKALNWLKTEGQK